MAERIKEKPAKEEKTAARAGKKEARKGQRTQTRGILKAITWPRPLEALKLTIYCGIASVAVGGLVYLYQYGISEIVAKFI